MGKNVSLHCLRLVAFLLIAATFNFTFAAEVGSPVGKAAVESKDSSALSEVKPLILPAERNLELASECKSKFENLPSVQGRISFSAPVGIVQIYNRTSFYGPPEQDLFTPGSEFAGKNPVEVKSGLQPSAYMNIYKTGKFLTAPNESVSLYLGVIFSTGLSGSQHWDPGIFYRFSVDEKTKKIIVYSKMSSEPGFNYWNSVDHAPLTAKVFGEFLKTANVFMGDVVVDDSITFRELSRPQCVIAEGISLYRSATTYRKDRNSLLSLGKNPISEGAQFSLNEPTFGKIYGAGHNFKAISPDGLETRYVWNSPGQIDIPEDRGSSRQLNCDEVQPTQGEQSLNRQRWVNDLEPIKEIKNIGKIYRPKNITQDSEEYKKYLSTLKRDPHVGTEGHDLEEHPAMGRFRPYTVEEFKKLDPVVYLWTPFGDLLSCKADWVLPRN